MTLINSITLIETIIKEGTLTASADALYVSQPYLSKILKQIEDDLGISIFDRLPRSMQITYAGERYLAYLKRMESIERDMITELDMISKHKIGKIRIGVNAALGSSIIPKIIPLFIEKYPDIEIELVEDDANVINYMLENHKIDVAIGMQPIKNEKFEYKFLYKDKMHLVVSNNSPLYNPALKEVTSFPYDLEVLNNLSLVSLDKGNGIRKLVDEFYNKFGLRYDTLLETKTIYTAIGLVRKGIANTFIPVTGMSWPRFNNCNLFVFDSDILKTNLFIFYLKDRSLSPVLETFIEMSIDILKEESKRFRMMMD